MKTNTVYLVHACDDWGTHKGIAGIYTDKEIAIDHIINDYRENSDLTESEIENAEYELTEYYHTQGITKADNFEIEVIELNEWDWR